MTAAPGTPRRARLVGISLLAGTLGAGLLAGAALDRAFASRDPAAGVAEKACGGRTPGGMFEALELTPEQRAQVDAILERRREGMEELWEQTGPRMRALVDSTETEIRKVLGPDQIEIFDRLRAERRARGFHKGFGRGAPPDSGDAGR